MRLLLIGEQRSGTTLLLQLIDAQPGCAARPGLTTALFATAVRLGVTPGARLSAAQAAALGQVARRVVPALGPGVESAPTLDDLYAAVLAAAMPGVELRAHKEHDPIGYVPALVDGTDARVIYLVRDVRDVMLSRRGRGDGRLHERIAEWAASWRIVRPLRDHPRVRVLRYEDLVGDPAAALAPVEAMLGRQLVSDPARLRELHPEWLRNSSFEAELLPLDRAPLWRWKAQRDDPLVRAAGWLCRAELGELGYPEPDRPAPPARATMAVRHALARLRGYARAPLV